MLWYPRLTMTQPISPRGTLTLSELRGISRLVIRGVVGVTDVVEDMYRNIARVSPPVGTAPTGRTRGITGLVYRSIRGITHGVGFGLDKTLAGLTPLLGDDAPPRRREAELAALNGVLGDYLAASKNPLAIPMHLRQHGRPLALERPALASQLTHSRSKLVVLVHGLCMHDLQWQREGHDHGASLDRDLGYTPVYLHYNSGRRIATNGREFAVVLERLVREWPARLSELVIVGHSMGGLVARSAYRHGARAGHSWPHRLSKLICLGTPHHGAPLERAGTWVDFALGISPYTAPLARVGKIRSAGIKDLHRGDVHGDASGEERRRFLEDVQCYAIAATREPQRPSSSDSDPRLPGDGWVPVDSALGRHPNATLELPIPTSQQSICFGLNHFDLLSSSEVYERIHSWLAES